MRKKQKIYLIAFFLTGLNSYGQSVKIDTLKVLNEFVYPVIEMGNSQIDSLINLDIRNKLIDEEFSKYEIKYAIEEWAKEGLSYLNFDVTYNANNMISLIILVEWCGAYCSNWRMYFNYSTLTGKPMEVNSIVDTSGVFRNIVMKTKTAQYEKAWQELKSNITEEDYKEVGISRVKYEQMMLEEYKELENAFNMETFILYPDYIEIITYCSFPHVIQALCPDIKLKFNYADIGGSLKTKMLLKK